MSDLKNPILGDIINSLQKDLELIPKGLQVATMTIISEFDTKFNLVNIGKYVDLSHGGIMKVKYGDQPNGVRSLTPEKSKGRRIKKVKKLFYNQTSLYTQIESPNGKKPRFINMKLFKNGSVHTTGCKSINDYITCITRLCDALTKIKAVVIKNQPNSPVTVKPFVDDVKKIKISEIRNVKVVMINSTFKIDYKIDRERLYDILNKKNIKSFFEPCVHACVNIKYNYMDRKDISIFVFESGSIIITGARNSNHISTAYQFIMDLLSKHRHAIIKYDIEDFISDPKLKQLLTNE